MMKKEQHEMTLRPVAHFRSPFGSKFGVPKQSGLVEELVGEVVFEPGYRDADYVRGIEGFEYLWLLWGFSANPHGATSPVVRPPVLGGNERVGVFATRSPFRPNPVGLSSVRLLSVETDAKCGPVLKVGGADLMDGTPIYDIKPYVPFVDAHPEACSSFATKENVKRLEVVVADDVAARFAPEQLEALRGALSLDPRPRVQQDPGRVYGMPFCGVDVHFRVEAGTVFVTL